MCCLACFVPKLTLIPSTSSPSSPIRVQRDEDFSISSTIELNCKPSLDIIIQWKIYSCTDSNCLKSIQIDSSISRTFNELYIPSQTLSYGLYQLKSTVTMNTSTSLKSSQSAYIQIIPAGITANLVPFGTSMITKGYQQDLQLNPGLYSIDLDGYEFNASVNFFRL